MKKAAQIILILTITIIVIVTGIDRAFVNNSSAAEIKKDNLTQTKNIKQLEVRFLGRTFYHKKDRAEYFDFTGSGMEFYFEGTTLEAQFLTDEVCVKDVGKQAWIAVYVNDEEIPSRRFPLDKKKKYYDIYQSDIKDNVKIRIAKLSEAKTGKSGIAGMRMNKEAKIIKTAKKQRSIEFIGDSITCGFGIEGTNTESFQTSFENGGETYAAKTAAYFNADYNVVAVSGIGIFSSVTYDGFRNSKLLMSSVYRYSDMMLQMEKKEFPYEVWNFKRFQPDLIIINLGVNDSTYVKNSKWKRDGFGAAYYKFINQVRRTNPESKIICAIRDNKKFLYEEIKEQVSDYNKRYQDNNITTMLLPSTRKGEGYGTKWHPNLKTHERMSEILIEKIKAEMNW